MSADRKDWGSVPGLVHKTLIEETERTGAAPPASALAETTGVAASHVRSVLRRLVDDGALAQPYGDRGPYVPLRDVDGAPVRMVLAREGSTPLGASDPLVALIDQLSAERRAEAERYLRFLVEQG